MYELQKELLKELSYDENDKELLIGVLKIFKRHIVDKAYKNLAEEDYLKTVKQINQAINTIEDYITYKI